MADPTLEELATAYTATKKNAEDYRQRANSYRVSAEAADAAASGFEATMQQLQRQIAEKVGLIPEARRKDNRGRTHVDPLSASEIAALDSLG